MTAGEIADRLKALEDERAIRRTLDDYGRAIDYGDDAAWLALFAQDATLELRYRPGLQPSSYGAPEEKDGRIIYAGRDQLATFIAAHSSAPECYHKHVVTNIRIEVTGDTANCESYFLRIDESKSTPIVVAAGRYVDHLIRAENGQWQFALRIAEIEARLRTE